MAENGTSEAKLTPKQQMFIALLCSGVNRTTAAKNAGVAERTAFRWLADEHFQQTYRAAQRAIFDESLTLLMQGIDDAIGGIKAIAKDSETASNVRLRAYQIWLEQAVSLHKTAELEQRIQELEKIIETRLS